MVATLPLAAGQRLDLLHGRVHVARPGARPARLRGPRGGRASSGLAPLPSRLCRLGMTRDQALVGGEAPGDLLCAAVETGHVVDDDDPAVGPVPDGLGHVGLDLVAAVAGQRDRLSFYVEGHGARLSPPRKVRHLRPWATRARAGGVRPPTRPSLPSRPTLPAHLSRQARRGGRAPRTGGGP